MPELAPFEVRLTAAVRSFADRAETAVDAIEVATRAAGKRRTGAFGWIGRTVPVPVPVLLVIALLVPFAWSLATGGLGPFRGSVGPIASPTPSPTASPSPSPTATPSPSVRPADPMAPGYVRGTATTTTQDPGTTTVDENGVAHTIGTILQSVEAMDDPRVSGTGTYRLGADGSGSLAFASGTFRLVNAGGAWEGTCSGGAWNDLAGTSMSCWLAGSGAYEGLTYYHNLQVMTAGDGEVTGVVTAGSPPSP